jgi:hypothetical protein
MYKEIVCCVDGDSNKLRLMLPTYNTKFHAVKSSDLLRVLKLGFSRIFTTQRRALEEGRRWQPVTASVHSYEQALKNYAMIMGT